MTKQVGFDFTEEKTGFERISELTYGDALTHCLNNNLFKQPSIDQKFVYVQYNAIDVLNGDPDHMAIYRVIREMQSRKAVVSYDAMFKGKSLEDTFKIAGELHFINKWQLSKDIIPLVNSHGLKSPILDNFVVRLDLKVVKNMATEELKRILAAINAEES